MLTSEGLEKARSVLKGAKRRADKRRRSRSVLKAPEGSVLTRYNADGSAGAFVTRSLERPLRQSTLGMT